MEPVRRSRIRTQEEVGPHAAAPVPDASRQGKGRAMITVFLITVVVIALAAGFILNRDDTRLRP